MRQLARWLLVSLAVAAAVWWWPVPRPGRSTRELSALPRLSPALDGVTLPPNLAPPSLRCEEPGRAWQLVAAGARGRPVTVRARRPALVLPLRAWHRLAAANAGGELTLTLSVRAAEGAWSRYQALRLTVAAEPIDRYLLHRTLTPLYNWARDVGLYQRDLTGYRSRLVLHARQFGNGCANCHTCWQGSGERCTLAVRSAGYGARTLLVDGRRVTRLEQAVGYGCWHPGGELVTFSVNQVRQFFHAAGDETRDVLDLSSGLVCYDLRRQRFVTAPALAAPGYLATYPCWAPDGRTLYFARARCPWGDRRDVPPPGYDTLRYALVRVAYDPATGAWGQVETVRASDERSFVFPRVSPDGRWLVYTSCDYGCFPIHRPNSELGLIELRTGADVPLTINSPRADTWHCWSRNGRWLVFASKRADGLFTKLYLSHFDGAGHFSPPVLLPQRDPAFYDTCWYSYNVPELLAQPLRVDSGRLGRAIRGGQGIAAPLPDEVAPPTPPER